MKMPILLICLEPYSMGLKLLYEVLKSKNFDTVFSYYFEDNKKQRIALKKWIKNFNPLFIGISFTAYEKDKAFDLSKIIKKSFPDIPLIFGGMHPTSSPRECLKYCDAVNIGEGECSIVEIAQKLTCKQDYRVANNLAYLDNHGNMIRNPLNPLIQNLDSLPISRPFTRDHIVFERGNIKPVDQKKYFELFPISNFRIIIISSRGCPNACSFCNNNLLSRLYLNWNKRRTYSPANLVLRVKEYVKYFPKHVRILFFDDDFLARDFKWFEEFCLLWKKELGLKMYILSYYKSVTDEKIKLLKSAGLIVADLGLQSASPKINQVYNRTFESKQFLNSVKILRQNNVNLAIHLLLDNPLEKYNDYEKTLDIVTKISKPFLLFDYCIKFYPGTDIEKTLGCGNHDLYHRQYNYSARFRSSLRPINQLFVVSYMLNSKMCSFLFDNIEKIHVRCIILPLLRFFCFFHFPFTVLKIYKITNFKLFIVVAWHSRHIVIKRIKAIFGF